MKRILWLLVLGLCLNSANAGQWRPVVGVSGIVGSSIVADHKTPSQEWEAGFYLLGTQFEAGVRHGHHEVYASYQRLNAAVERDMGSFWHVSDDEQHVVSGWRYDEASGTEQRTLIGYRYWPLEFASRFKPVIGIGAGIVESTLRRHSWGSTYAETREGSNFVPDGERHSFDYGETVHSKTIGDLLLESGVACDLVWGMEALALAQFHVYGTDYSHGFSSMHGCSGVYLLPSLALQLRYTFGQ